ncbi:MAG: LLM class flavin-dependent oxidoreductase [Chloroflexi bacterium]|nr:LLM class flavin-dependent oxidoreductase [Chloroflexota bacterium]
MAEGTIGVQIEVSTAPAFVDAVQRAEQMGVPAVWATSGDPLDSLALFAAAAARTERILLGTAITRTFSRHPIVTALESITIAQLAAGRFRLGLGASSQRIQSWYGVTLARPIAHTRAYVRAVKALLETGAVDIAEEGIVARYRLPAPPQVRVPVLAAALRRGAFRMSGAVADGAISWICPAVYIRDVALPALREGAAAAGRPAPTLVMHVPVCISDDRTAARAALRERFGMYVRFPYYAAMFTDAGFPEAQQGEWSDAMLDAVAVYGPEAEVADRLRERLALGATELLVTAVGTAPQPERGVERVWRLIADLSRERVGR